MDLTAIIVIMGNKMTDIKLDAEIAFVHFCSYIHSYCRARCYFTIVAEIDVEIVLLEIIKLFVAVVVVVIIAIVIVAIVTGYFAATTIIGELDI